MDIQIRDNKCFLRGIPLEEIAQKYGTPFYLYDLNCIEEKIRKFRESFGSDVRLYYAMKANPNIEILKAIRDKVDGLDISSGGEMEQSLLAGYIPRQLSFAGPGKTNEELEEAVRQEIGIISVESVREIVALTKIADKLSQKANIALRINPNLLIKEFAVKMGGMPTQFGIDEEEIERAVQVIKEHLALINFQGIHIYSGTQCLNEGAIIQNIRNTLQIAQKFESGQQMNCRWVNLGGGFGISLHDDQKLDISNVGDGVKKALLEYRQTVKGEPIFVIELGRYLTTEAGIYVAKVVGSKKSRGKMFYVLDGGMNHHLAASGNFGMAIRRNYPARNLSNPGGERVTCNLVGPLCTTLDLMGRDIGIESPREGDLLAFDNSGSYGYSASPFLFLGHESPPELLLDSNELRVIRTRKKMTGWN